MAKQDSKTPSVEDVRQLRNEIVVALADISANILPDVCERLGLAKGAADESFRSKRSYVDKRITGLSAAQLIDLGHKVRGTNTTYGLEEALSKVESTGRNLVSELTRRRIMALFDKWPLSTQLEHMDFLGRVWPLHAMPSRFEGTSHKSLQDDFFQATVRNSDWSEREMLENVGLLECSQSRFFTFLEEVTSPIAQTEDVQIQLSAAINEHLKHDGYRLMVVKRLSGSPLFQVQETALGSPADASISAALRDFDEDTVHARWLLALERRESDPEGAITLARTLLEDVCKWITVEAGEEYDDKDELPVLYKRLAKILKLAPDDHTESVFKQILGSCQSVVESLGALRNRLSSAHSIGPKRVKPAPRHAALAVNLSGSMATFLVETWMKVKQAQTPPSV